MSDKKYWHELPQQEVDELINRKVTNQFVMDNYLQPAWCTYPKALNGSMGCWTLTDNCSDVGRKIISVDFCKDCDCFKEVKA